MKRTSIGRIALDAILALVFALSLSAGENDDDPSLLDAPRLSEDEMASAGGRLHIFGVRISLRLKRNSRRQTNRYPGAEHCDIIAQNRADAMGLDTRNQDGSTTDYNGARVSRIYSGFGNNRYSQPPAGTSGYYFTTNDSQTYTKQHMGAYSRRAGSSTYTRYWNNSFTESVSRNTPLTYVPDRVTGQSFVPLPRRSATDLYYR